MGSFSSSSFTRSHLLLLYSEPGCSDDEMCCPSLCTSAVEPMNRMSRGRLFLEYISQSDNLRVVLSVFLRGISSWFGSHVVAMWSAQLLGNCSTWFDPSLMIGYQLLHVTFTRVFSGRLSFTTTRNISIVRKSQLVSCLSTGYHVIATWPYFSTLSY